MTRQAIIEKTLKVINQLPEDKAEEIADFADFMIKRFEDQQLSETIKELASKSESFKFLEEEEEIYALTDLKEIYNG